MMMHRDDVPIVPLSFPDDGFWITMKGISVKVVVPIMLSPDFSSWKFPEKSDVDNNNVEKTNKYGSKRL
jgi:hypothetical protein